jgi:hypothetical protein
LFSDQFFYAIIGILISYFWIPAFAGMTIAMAYKSKKAIRYFIPAVILIGAVFYFIAYKNRTTLKAIEIKQQEIADNSNNIIPEEKNDTSQAVIDEEIKQPDEEKNPDKIIIKVPFTSQAPLSVWDEKHEEACEEASLVMIKYYLDKKALNKNIAEKEIQDMIKFEIKKYGDYKDTDASETVKLANDFYGIKNLKVVYDFKAGDIKKYLAQNNPIIIPAAGRKLGNPNFTSPGPLYHNLVLVGYDGDTIITNDPGTRKGEGYKYNIDALYDAIHDFPGKPEDILRGKKAMIIIE